MEDWGVREILILLCAPFGWYAITRFERQYTFLTSVSNLILWKLVGKPILSLFVGPFAIVVIVPVFIIKRIIKSQQEKRE